MGSPPLTRGPQIHDFAFYHWLRITPAHAGTTLPPCNPLRLAEDHPRSRGDHRSGHSLRSIKYGSPPLTRGPQKVDVVGLGTRGSTPAHAGTKRGRREPPEDAGDHPRSRGDHTNDKTRARSSLYLFPKSRKSVFQFGFCFSTRFRRTFFRPHHQSDAIEIHWSQIAIVNQNIEMLLTLGRMNENRAPFFQRMNDPVPQHIFDASCDPSHIDPRFNLQKPFRHISAQ